MRSVLGAGPLAAVMLALAISSAVAAEQFKAWRKQCETLPGGQVACNIVQDVRTPQGDTVMMRAQVGFIPQQNQALLLITLPLGVALKPGLQLRVDQIGTWPMGFDVCTADGCRAALPLDAKLLKALKKGVKAAIAVKELRGQTLSIPLSLLGFTRGFEAIGN